jgi:hypothetical protein
MKKTTSKTNEVQPAAPSRRVWWASLKERAGASHDVSADSLEKVAMMAGAKGYGKLSLPYMRTDSARNQYAKKFLEVSTSPVDVLIMMDNDHEFPVDILPRLVAHITDEVGGRGVVGALAFKRGEPFEPCFFTRGEDGILHSIAYWEDGLYEGTVIGHACVAIARWVFDKLLAEGKVFPFWRYTYIDGQWESPSEDMYFAQICEASGISHWCDTTLECPHLILGKVDRAVWHSYLEAHQHLMAYPTAEVPVMLGSPNPTWAGRNE